MDVKTHIKISRTLVGIPIDVVEGVRAVAELTTIGEMAVDSSGLIHGGFTFGLADYAAMLTVDHPNVVLGSAQTKFTAPVRVGDTMRAEANIVKTEGKKSEVNIEVKIGDRKVLAGVFECYTLDKHVLDNDD
jgi:acyl-coenzyme A thioesterase PaaI-like protein